MNTQNSRHDSERCRKRERPWRSWGDEVEHLVETRGLEGDNIFTSELICGGENMTVITMVLSIRDSVYKV